MEAEDVWVMDLGYLVSNGRYIDCADNDFASFACLSSHLDSCLDSLIEMSSSRLQMKIKDTLKVKRREYTCLIVY